MSQVFNKLYLDVRLNNKDIVTEAVQGDTNSRFLDVYLTDNGVPINLTGHEVRLYGVKGDTTEFYNNGTITEATNGRCQFELTSQALSAANNIKAQVVIYYNNVQILQTAQFTIKVTQSLISESAIESSNEYGALVVLFQELYEAKDLMLDMVQNFGEHGEIATEYDAETFWKMLELMAHYMKVDLTDLLNNVLQNANIIGVINRLGETTDTGGTDTAGTLMAKANYLIARNQKNRGIKVTTVTIPQSTDDFEALNVSGAGTLIGVYGIRTSDLQTLSLYYDTSSLVYSADESTSRLLRPSMDAFGDIGLIKMGVSGSGDNMMQYGLPLGIEFNNSLSVKVDNIVAGARNLTIVYSIYE